MTTEHDSVQQVPQTEEQLLPRHIEAAKLRAEGLSYEEIGRRLEPPVAGVTVGRWQAGAMGELVDRFRRESIETALCKFTAHIGDCADTVLKVVRGPSGRRWNAQFKRLQLDAANSVLDRVLGKSGGGSTGAIIEAIQRDGEQGIRVIIGYPPGQAPRDVEIIGKDGVRQLPAGQ